MADQSPVTPPLPIAPPVATPPADPPPADPPSLVSSDNASEFKLERYNRLILRSLWRWYETYILLFMVVAVLAIYVERQIIPLVR